MYRLRLEQKMIELEFHKYIQKAWKKAAGVKVEK